MRWRAARAQLFWTIVTVALGLGLLLPGSSIARAQPVEPSSARLAAISPQLEWEFATAEAPIAFLAILEEQPDLESLLATPLLAAADRATRAAAIYARLTDHAARTQAPLRAWLDREGIPYRAFYLVNMIEIYGDAEIGDALRRRGEIDRLAANPAIAQPALPEPDDVGPAPSNLRGSGAPAAVDLPYGLVFTNAPDVWAMGYTGAGIVVAGQDTGVDWSHPALIGSYRGWSPTTGASHAYNWFDAWAINAAGDVCRQDPQSPCDDHGHGTHTMGTMVGDASDQGGRVVGMAPDSRWIGCRNMLDGVGTPASYTACFEFMLAPYPQDGDPFTDGHPELAPHIINNSWGCPPIEGCDTQSLRQVVETVRAAGQFVVAAAGNDGSSCASVVDPIAIYDASFSIGAHNAVGTIASFSSRGPVTVDGSGRRKPDITAPGVAVSSTLPSNSYGRLDGTSMAAPHVAGAAALLWSAAPSLVGDVDLTEQVLLKSATPAPNNGCDPGAEPATPNNTYGFGRLDVLAAVELAQQPSSATVTLQDCDGAALASALAELVDPITGFTYAQLTNIAGVAQFPAIFTAAFTETYALGAVAGSAQFAASNATLHRGAKGVFELKAGICNAPATASVQVTNYFGEPVPNAQVTLRDTRTQNIYQALSDDAGLVSFPAIYAGTYALNVTAPELHFAQQSLVAEGGQAVEAVAKGEPLVWRLFAPVVAR